MPKRSLLLLLCLTLALTSGCGKKEETPQAPAAAVQQKAGDSVIHRP